MNIQTNASQKKSHAEVIAHAWCRAITNKVSVSDEIDETYDRLAQLAERCLILLSAEIFSLQEAQAVGAALVDLSFHHGNSLGTSIELLARELPAGLSDEQQESLQPRLYALLGGITHGFFMKTAFDIEAEQVFVGKEVEQKQLFTTERFETLRKIESGILQAESPQAIADIALLHMERVIPSTSAVITLFQSSDSEAVILANRNAQMKPGDSVPTAQSQIEVLKKDQALIVDDIMALPEKTGDQQVGVKLGARSSLSVPLLIHGELIGVMSLVDTNPNAFSEQDVQLTRQIGNSIAVAIQNARLLVKEQRARREAETLREVAASINTGLEQEELLDLMLAQLEQVLPSDMATIYLQKEGKLEIAAYRGKENRTPASYPSIDETPPNVLKIVNEQRPLLIANSERNPAWLAFPGRELVKCWMGAPLVVKNKFIGMLMLDKEESDFYTERDMGVVLAFANQAAAAIENAELYRRSQQYTEMLERRVAERTSELSALYEITAISSQHLELQETLEKMMSVISETLDCKTVTIQIVDEADDTLRLACQQGLSPQMVDYMKELPIDHLFMEEIMKREEPKILEEPSTNPFLCDIPINAPVPYGVGAAIRSEGSVLGILGLAISKPQPLSPEDIALITSITDHIGVAIDNARLRQKSEQLAVLQERERLARDLHDSATQSLFSLTLFTAAAREHLGRGQLRSVRRQLDELEETAVQTHKEMRLLLYKLRPTELEVVGLAGALRRRMQMVELRSGIRGHIKTELSSTLPVIIEQTLFQVASEALNNTLKHSGADTVSINIVSENSSVIMNISDNGRGFAMDDVNFSAGMGLDNMYRRVAEMGGTFQYESQPNGGTTIDVKIPIMSENTLEAA